jgi:hypothetical protein
VSEGPLARALELAGAFERGGVAYAIGGALAYSVWGIPRATVDVDINVFVDETKLGPVLDALQGLGITVDRVQATRDATVEGMFIVHHGGYRVDLFTASIPYCQEAERTRVQVDLGGQRAWFLCAESVAVFKMLFFRPKDIADLERLVAVRGEALDRAYVRAQLVDAVGVDDPRIERWERIAGLEREARAPEFIVDRGVLLRGNKFFAVLHGPDGTPFEVELGDDMVGKLRDGDRVRISARGIEVLEPGVGHSRGR